MVGVNMNTSGLGNIITNFNKIDGNTDGKIDGKLSIEELKNAKGLSPEGTMFLQNIINNPLNTFGMIESVVNDGKGISKADLEKIQKEPTSNIAYLIGTAENLKSAINYHETTLDAGERGSAILINTKDGDNGLPEDLHNLFSIALYRAGTLSKDEYDFAIGNKGFNWKEPSTYLKDKTSILRSGIDRLQQNAKNPEIPDGDSGNKIGRNTINEIFKQIEKREKDLNPQIKNEPTEIKPTNTPTQVNPVLNPTVEDSKPTPLIIKIDSKKDGDRFVSDVENTLSNINNTEDAKIFSNYYKKLPPVTAGKVASAVEKIVGKNLAPFFLNGPIKIKMDATHGNETLNITPGKFHLKNQPYCLFIQGLENSSFKFKGQNISDSINFAGSGNDYLYFAVSSDASKSSVFATGEGTPEPTVIKNDPKNIALAKEKINFAYKNTKLSPKLNEMLKGLIINLDMMNNIKKK